ncbi:hypothetical protein V6K52_07115 [Knoellia sp. S7-12]|uniref:hypothetical protein n=1 Tax=Knoellia sp. S7-12 TaxID=3126698 RepID=UPI003367BA10
MAGMDAAPAPVAHASRDGYEIKNGEVVRTVFVTVTGWAPGTGAQRFADLQNNTIGCRFVTPHERLPWTGRDLASSWLSKHRNGVFTSYLASQRVGDVIVSVVVDRTKPQGQEETAAKQDAIRLADEIIAKLKASDLPAAKGL